MTNFNLIIRLNNGQRLKVMETRNATRIRKEVLLLRKFLNLQEKDGTDIDDDLAIYDEVRDMDGDKCKDRFAGAPKRRQIVNSSGEKLMEDEADTEVEIVERVTMPLKQD